MEEPLPACHFVKQKNTRARKHRARREQKFRIVYDKRHRRRKRSGFPPKTYRGIARKTLIEIGSVRLVPARFIVRDARSPPCYVDHESLLGNDSFWNERKREREAKREREITILRSRTKSLQRSVQHARSQSPRLGRKDGSTTPSYDYVRRK